MALLFRSSTVAALTALAVALPVTAALAPHALVSPAQSQSGPTSVADLAERLLPSVVNISTSQNVSSPNVQRPQRRPNSPEGSPFQEFFDEFFDDNEGGSEQPEQRTRRVNSLGSGFVIDAKEGIVITNNHVIADADEITINFSDGDSLDAEIIGRDPKTDIAVLKVDPSKKDLVAVDLGDSEKARIGDWVMAIGNPFGLGGTVTVGIISAQNRNINSGPYDRFIQTDAAINRGNSGGPLFNMDGDVIGINTAIISPSGGSIGIGFSIPSELASGVIAQLREFGETRRGYLGVRIQPVTDDMAEGLGMDEAKGVMISGLIDDGPAIGGELEAGDIILTFDGKDVNEPRDLSRAVAETAVGKDVAVDILRKGEPKSITVTLGRLEDGEAQMAAAETEEEPAEPEMTEVLGLSLQELTDEKREEFEINPDVKGVLIGDVKAGSAAEEKGLKAGMVIVEVAQETVEDAETVVAQIDELKELGRKNALLMVSTPTGELSFITLRMD